MQTDSNAVHAVPAVPTVAHQLDSLALHSQALRVDSTNSMTALRRCVGGVVQMTWSLVLIVYSLCISGIFALFANRRAEDNYYLSALFVSASLIYNVFGALMFGKRVGNFVIQSYEKTKQCDGVYLSLWSLSLIMAAMTAMAGVKISEDSVQILKYQLAIKVSVGMFVFNTLSTRWAGGLDLWGKVYKEIRYYHFDKFLQDWRRYNGASLISGFSPDNSKGIAHHEQLIAYFYNQLAENKASLPLIEELKFYGDKIVKSVVGSVSFLLFPMWISLTANGLKAIDPASEKSAYFTIFCAFSNLPFYFMSSFNLLPNSKLLLSLLAEKLNPEATCIRNLGLGAGFMIFVALAIVSGGGYGMEVKDMEKNGYGNTTYDIVPNKDLSATNSFASYFAMVVAGWVNFANTAKFFADVLSVQKNNPPISFARAMGIYMDLASIPVVQETALEVQQAETVSAISMPVARDEEVAVAGDEGLSDAQVQAYFEEIKLAFEKNRFDVSERAALSVGESAVKITSDAIKAGRKKWSSATSWCSCSWFGSKPQANVRLTQNLLDSNQLSH